MPFLDELSCGRCARVDDQVLEQGMVRDPSGWSVVTVVSTPMLNQRLCPTCAGDLRALLATSPMATELARDAENEATYTRGFAAGWDAAHDTLGGVAEGAA